MKRDWSSTPNALRKRKQIHVTMSPEGIAELDAQRGNASRGAFIEELVGRMVKVWSVDGTKLSRKNRPKGT